MCLYIIPPPSIGSTSSFCLHHHTYHPVTISYTTMAPKPASTAGKAPASVASKAPAKAVDTAGKKKPVATPVEGEKKKRKKVRKETYSSYIYKGSFSLHLATFLLKFWFQFSSRSIPILVFQTRPWPSSIVLSMISLNELPLRHLVGFFLRLAYGFEI